MSYETEWPESESEEGQAEEAVAMFAFADNPGLLVSPDDEDNPDNHVVLHQDAGTKVSFAVFNVGTAPGTCEVGIEVDNTYITGWTSSELPPQGSEAPEVKGLGRYAAGQHEFLVYLNPGAGYLDHLMNTVEISDI